MKSTGTTEARYWRFPENDTLIRRDGEVPEAIPQTSSARAQACALAGGECCERRHRSSVSVLTSAIGVC